MLNSLLALVLLTLVAAGAAHAEDSPRPVSVVLDAAADGPTSPAVLADGVAVNPYAYLIHDGDRDRHYGQMAAAGVRVYTVNAGITPGPDGFNTAGLGAPYDAVLKHCPDALIFPRVGVTPPEWWHERNPGNRVVFDDGSEGPQSMFSEAWLRDACQWVEQYARYIRNSAYAGHVMGIHICSGTTAEWQSWGLWDNKRGDFSEPARIAWRAYLADKYGSDQALSAAWGREATLQEAEVPTRARRETPPHALRSPAEFQDVFDFYDFYWRGTAKAIEALAAAAKRGGGRDWLVGFFYGYAIQFGGKAQESQHLGMRRLLDCPDIDFFCSPAMYSDRGPGGTSTFMSYTESVKLAGKLWWDEADNRTHLCVDPRFSAVFPAKNLAESVDVLKREFAHTMARRSAVWWFDMSGAWYDDPTLMELHRDMCALAGEHKVRWQPDVQAAFFVDDKSSYRMPPESGYLSNMTQLMAAMPRLGAPYDTYILSDLPKAPQYDVYVFPNAFDLTAEEREAIDSLKRDGNILVFMGAAGQGAWCDDRTTILESGTEDLLGFVPGNETVTRDYGSWRCVWWPTPAVGVDALREAIRDKAHIYLDSGDTCYLGNGIAAVHARTAGDKTLTFPHAVVLKEVLTDGPASFTGAQVSVPVKAMETRFFVVAPE